MKTPTGGTRRCRSLAGIRSVLALLGVAIAPTLGHAQEAPPFDPAVDVQLFDYAIGPKSYLTVTDGDVQHAKQFSLDFLLTFFTNPFIVYDFDDDNEEIG